MKISFILRFRGPFCTFITFWVYFNDKNDDDNIDNLRHKETVDLCRCPLQRKKMIMLHINYISKERVRNLYPAKTGWLSLNLFWNYWGVTTRNRWWWFLWVNSSRIRSKWTNKLLHNFNPDGIVVKILWKWMSCK